MKKIYLSCLFTGLLMSASAQNEFFMQAGSSVTIQSGGLLYVRGEIEGQGTASMSNNGLITLAGNSSVAPEINWQSGNAFSPSGTVRFVGGRDGSVGGGGNIQIGTLESKIRNITGTPPATINNGILTINQNVIVTNVLSIDSGIISIPSASHELSVTNDAAAAVTTASAFGIQESNYVVGKLKRNVVAGRTYQFPIGTDLNGYNLAELDLTTVPSGVTALTAFFKDEANLGNILFFRVLNCTPYGGVNGQHMNLNSMFSNFGYWDFTPNGPTTGWNYSGKFYPNLSDDVNFNTASGDIIKLIKTSNNISSSYTWTDSDVLASGDLCNAADYDAGNPLAPFKYSSSHPSHPGNRNFLAISNVTSFSGFGGAGGGGIGLPVELISLQADAIDNEFIKVSWATATEINNSGFEVMRSEDGVNFENIGWVNGNGNSTAQINYSFDDRDVKPNTVYYYRLRQVDYDGQSELTNIVSAMITDDAVFVISEFMPNPTENTTSFTVVTAEKRDLNLIVYNTLGQIISDERLVANPATTNKYTVNLSEMASGTYYAVITTGEHTFNKKIVVSR